MRDASLHGRGEPGPGEERDAANATLEDGGLVAAEGEVAASILWDAAVVARQDEESRGQQPQRAVRVGDVLD